MTRKSCAVGKRNAILRNTLNRIVNGPIDFPWSVILNYPPPPCLPPSFSLNIDAGTFLMLCSPYWVTISIAIRVPCLHYTNKCQNIKTRAKHRNLCKNIHNDESASACSTQLTSCSLSISARVLKVCCEGVVINVEGSQRKFWASYSVYPPVNTTLINSSRCNSAFKVLHQ